MKRFTRIKSNVYAPTSTDLISQNMVYWKMSHHYQRIRNAKKVVDSSAPSYYKTLTVQPRHRLKSGVHVQSSIGSRTSSVADLHSCSEKTKAVTGFGLKHEKKQFVTFQSRKQQASPKDCRHCKSADQTRFFKEKDFQNPEASVRCRTALEKSDTVKLHRKGRKVCNKMEADQQFKQRIISKNAESKIENLVHYHPPCKRVNAKKLDTRSENLNISSENREHQSEDGDCIEEGSACSGSCDTPGNWSENQEIHFLPNYSMQNRKTKVGSELSSCDSAYNGGISSGGNSRGSSPEHERNFVDLRRKCRKETDLLKKDEYISDTSLQFTNGIIDEIVKKNALSNSEIRNIIKIHMTQFEGRLDKIKMVQEAKKLMNQLDILDGVDDCQDQTEATNNCNSFISCTPPEDVNSIFTTNTINSELCDPFDDNLLLQEYKLELEKYNLKPYNFSIPTCGGIELTLDYMCTYPVDDHNSVEILDEDFWLESFKVNSSVGLLTANDNQFVGQCSHVAQTELAGCSKTVLKESCHDIDHKHHTQNTKISVSDLESFSENEQVPQNISYDCTQVSFLLEVLRDCKLSDS